MHWNEHAICGGLHKGIGSNCSPDGLLHDENCTNAVWFTIATKLGIFEQLFLIPQLLLMLPLHMGSSTHSCGHNDEQTLLLPPWGLRFDLTAQALFITDVGELGEWMANHPEYSQDQKNSLTNAIADFKGLKKKDKAIFISSVQAHGNGE